MEGCDGLNRYQSYEAKCSHLISEGRCVPQGYINYLHIFYCIFGKHAALGYTVLLLWLTLLFYLLGSTAANFFCSNLQGLSRLLKLSPAVAGATLLSLGNGTPDAFSTIISFMGRGTDSVGLNTVLGGAFFVSCVVMGTISICVGPRMISFDKLSFVRDICFLLFVLLVLLVIIIMGEINLWSAVAFTSLYLAYVFVVAVGHLFRKEDGEKGLFDEFSPLPTSNGELGAPLFGITVMDDPASTAKGNLPGDGLKAGESKSSASYYFSRIIDVLELPLCLPRRLTIPVVCEKRWSKPFAVASVTLAPVLLAALLNSKRKKFGSEESLVIYLFGGVIGTILGIAALLKTEKERPPQRFLFPWLAGGFLMSVTWAYMTAQELVSLLVSLGVVLGISPSVLGLTVLAWGNSLGDMVANVAVALNGGPDGAQVAASGCYGGPIFNTLVGLGLSMVLSSWADYPSPLPIPEDPTLLPTLLFLIGGLLWALVMLPMRGMKLDRVLGFGLVAIYLCFLSLRFAESLGLILS